MRVRRPTGSDSVNIFVGDKRRISVPVDSGKLELGLINLCMAADEVEAEQMARVDEVASHMMSLAGLEPKTTGAEK